MKNLLRYSLVVLGFTAPVSWIHAQTIHEGPAAEKMIPGTELVRYVDGRTAPDFIRFRSESRVSSGQALNWLGSALSMGEDNELRFLKEETDKLGMTHVFYRHYYLNVPVEFSEYRTHNLNGMVVSMNGQYYQNLNLSVTPSISATAAIEAAKTFVGATAYKWEIPSEETFIKTESGDPNASFAPSPELVIISRNADYINPNFRLAWKMDIYAHEPMSRRHVYVDALTGEILWSENEICHADVTGTGTTGYSGVRSFTSDSFNGGFRLREAARGNGIQTFDLNNGTNYGNAVDFTDADNIWNNLNPANDRFALDAHWGAEMTYDYYMNIHNRNSIDGNGFALISYVHYSNNYGNAFWDGQRMTYGDGGGSFSGPLTSLDITGHEITHGLTSNSANLVYQNQSGALNESFSDIFGVTIDFHARGTAAPQLWLIGDECANGVGIRNMANPGQFGDPDTYGTGNWYTGTADNGGVHWNSGVQNFWYYLLCTGGTGTNDYGNAYNVSQIGMISAEAIAFRNLTVYLGANSQYVDSRFYAIQSAIDLFGNCSPEVIATTNAWYAVGVGTPFNATVSAGFTAPVTQFCSANTPVSFTNTSTNGNSYKWYFGDGDSSTATNPSHVYGNAGSFTVTLITDGGPCGVDTLVMPNFIVITPPASPVASNVSTCSPSASFTLNATASNTINWYYNVNDVLPFFTGNSYTTPLLTNTTTYYLENSVPQTPVSTGPVNNSFGTGGQHNNQAVQYLTFDVFQPCTLVSVWVNAGSTGNRTINLWNSAGVLITSQTVNIPSGQSTVTLNLPLQPGSYRIGGNNMNLYRNNAGAQYPYNNTSLVSITGSSAGSAFYYYFYNWQLQAPACNSPRVPVTATFSTPPNVIANANNTSLCQGDQLILTGSGAQTYSWDNNVTDGLPFTPSNSGSYIVTGTDTNNCTGSDTISITVNALPNVTANANNSTVCQGGTVILTGGGAQNYSWDNGVTDGLAFTPANSGAYIVTGTDQNNCSNTDTIAITVNALPAVTANANNNPVCSGTMVTLTGGGAQNYSWDNGVTDGIAFTPASTTTYIVTGTDANNCTGADTITVVVNSLPTVSFTLSTPDICKDNGLVALSGSPSGGTFSGPGVTGNNFDPAAVNTGSHVITYSYTDGNGCTNIDTDVISVANCLGIETQVLSQVKIYPNPSQGDFTIEFAEASPDNIVNIYNAIGQRIYAANAPGQLHTVNLTISAGIYIVEISDKISSVRQEIIVY